MLIASFLQHAIERPADAALWVAGRWWSWHELLQVVVTNADRMAAVPAGTRVVTTFSNDARAVIGALALMASGHVEIPLGDGRAEQDVDAVCRRSSAAIRLASEDIQLVPTVDISAALERLRQGIKQRRSTDDALILWTSGTTAEPRGVVLSCGALQANALGKLTAVPQSSHHRRLTVLPLWHSFARTCDFGTWLLSGCRLAVTLGWQGMLDEAPAVEPHLVSLVPSLVKRMLAEAEQDLGGRLHAWGLGQLRILSCGGAALAADDYRALSQQGICVIHGYGLTEAGPVVCSASPQTARPGYVGRPICDTQIRIDANGQLWARGPGLMTGYLDDPEATAAVLQDGWLRSGDLATQDADGMVRILGRCDDTIVCSNGLKIQPLEIEQCLERSVDVRHAVLWQDAVGQLVAIIEPTQFDRPSMTVQTGLEALTAKLPGWQRPRRWVILPQPFDRHERTAKGTPRRRIVGPRYAAN